MSNKMKSGETEMETKVGIYFESGKFLLHFCSSNKLHFYCFVEVIQKRTLFSNGNKKCLNFQQGISTVSARQYRKKPAHNIVKWIETQSFSKGLHGEPSGASSSPPPPAHRDYVPMLPSYSHNNTE